MQKIPHENSFNTSHQMFSLHRDIHSEVHHRPVAVGPRLSFTRFNPILIQGDIFTSPSVAVRAVARANVVRGQ